ncbi:unnamed protein product [Sphagnum jensenii]|uniref:Thaumatin-like protein n=1 Tax=Sphagnum jensenii TaxID=128206 RepID=A0ABP0WG57_9BRYO
MKNSMQTAALALLMAAVATSVAIHSIDDMLRRWYSHLLRIGTWKRKAFDRRGGKLARWRNLGISGNKADPVDGNEAKPQADLAEFTIGSGNLDFYDISNVNGFNLPLMITVTTIVSPGKKSGLECGNPKCGSININSFCQSPNKITGGPGDGCYNVDGPTATSPTNGTEAFANACPDAFSYSTDIANHVYFCQTGSEYSVVFCPIPFGLNTLE